MTDPVRTALEKAACEMCICEGECYETLNGMMHGPCEKKIGNAAKAIAAFLRALPDLSVCPRLTCNYNGSGDSSATLAAAIRALGEKE